LAGDGGGLPQPTARALRRDATVPLWDITTAEHPACTTIIHHSGAV
jgi:hypothetical protein